MQKVKTTNSVRTCFAPSADAALRAEGHAFRKLDGAEVLFVLVFSVDGSRFGGFLFLRCTECGIERCKVRAWHGEHDVSDSARVRFDPRLYESDDLLVLGGIATATEGAHDQRLGLMDGCDAQDGIEAPFEAKNAFALGAVVFQSALAVRFGDGEHVCSFDGSFANEDDVLQVQRAIGEQLTALVTPVGVVIVAL